MGDFAKGSGYVAQYFKIVPRSLEGAVAVDGVVGDTEFTYSPEGQDVKFALDGAIIPDDAYTVAYYKDGDKVTNAKDAGDYIAILTGEVSKGYASEQVKVPFTVDKLDLSTADIFAEDIQKDVGVYSTTDIVTIDGSFTLSAIWDNINQSQTAYTDAEGDTYGASDSDNFESLSGQESKDNELGAYKFMVTAKKNDPNVTGTAEYTVNVVETKVAAASFLYDGVRLNSDYNETTNPKAINGRTLDLSEGESYDASKISVTGYDADDYTVSLATADAQTPGEYTVSVRMNVPADFSVGGGSQASFKVVAGVIDTNTVDAVAIIGGVNVPFGTTAPVYYNGEPVVPTIILTCGDKTLVAGEDYTVTYTDAAGNPVEEMVDAGTYRVTVESDTYEFASDCVNWFNVQIDKRSLDVRVVQPVFDPERQPGILYTGEEIALQLVGTYTAEGKTFDVTLDPSWYLLSGLQYMAPEAESYSPAESVLGVGDYKVNVSPTAACVNYTWKAENGVGFQVVDNAYFTDVDASEWYAGEVNDAAFQGYIKGVGDTKLFMPMNSINRAELSQVLFNMAGQAVGGGIAYPTPFSDVPELAWFAQPVSWASQAGIVTGMGDTGTFAPYDNATREQVATMFYRYAQTQAMDVSGRADLSGYADEAAVSDWAADAVAWAVEAGVFGQGTETLRPSDPISRAEVAAMAIRLQPEPLTSADVTA